MITIKRFMKCIYCLECDNDPQEINGKILYEDIGELVSDIKQFGIKSYFFFSK